MQTIFDLPEADRLEILRRELEAIRQAKEALEMRHWLETMKKELFDRYWSGDGRITPSRKEANDWDWREAKPKPLTDAEKFLKAIEDRKKKGTGTYYEYPARKLTPTVGKPKPKSGLFRRKG